MTENGNWTMFILDVDQLQSQCVVLLVTARLWVDVIIFTSSTSSHETLSFSHGTQCSLHGTLYSLHETLFLTRNSMFLTRNSVSYTETLCSLHGNCVPHTELCSTHRTLCSLHGTLCFLHGILYSLHRTLFLIRNSLFLTRKLFLTRNSAPDTELCSSHGTVLFCPSDVQDFLITRAFVWSTRQQTVQTLVCCFSDKNRDDLCVCDCTPGNSQITIYKSDRLAF